MFTKLSVRQKNLLRVVVFKVLVHYRYSAFMLKLLDTRQHELQLLFARRIIAQVPEQAEATRKLVVDIKYFDFRIR